MAKLSKYKLFEMACRSFLVQACWNFDRMQNVGFAFSILPALKCIYSDKTRIKSILKRHLEFFNSQPYMSVFAIGSIAKMEEIGEDENFIECFKKGLFSPLGAIGDTFFWASLRPTVGLLALFFAFIGNIWAPLIIFILLYNVPHLLIRFQGINDGYTLGVCVINKIRNYKFYEKAKMLRDFGMIVSGYLIVLLIYFVKPTSLELYRIKHCFSIVNLILVAVIAILLKLGIKPFKILLLLIFASLLAGYFGFLH